MTSARRLTPDRPARATDVWAWCGVCQRWFYPRVDTPEMTCPVCATPAEKTAEQPESAS